MKERKKIWVKSRELYSDKASDMMNRRRFWLSCVSGVFTYRFLSQQKKSIRLEIIQRCHFRTQNVWVCVRLHPNFTSTFYFFIWLLLVLALLFVAVLVVVLKVDWTRAECIPIGKFMQSNSTVHWRILWETWERHGLFAFDGFVFAFSVCVRLEWTNFDCGYLWHLRLCKCDDKIASL